MPTYEYRCPNGHRFELFQKMTDEPVAECPECGAEASRQISGGAGFLFGVLAVLLEWQARRIPVDRIFWGAIGGTVGLGLGLGLGTAMGAVSPDAGPLGRGLFGLIFSYLGAAVALVLAGQLAVVAGPQPADLALDLGRRRAWPGEPTRKILCFPHTAAFSWEHATVGMFCNVAAICGGCWSPSRYTSSIGK